MKRLKRTAINPVDRVEESLLGKRRVAAASLILDRLEGKPPQEVEFNNVSRDLASRSDDELRYCIDHGCWPERPEVQATASKPSGTA